MNKQELLEKIKISKKYKQVSEEIILKEIENYIKKNPKYEESKDEKILKDIKAELYKITGRFQVHKKLSNNRDKFLEELKQDINNIEIINNILKTNHSTKERLEDYKEVYDNIFKITGKVESILDLGCGLNPIYYVYNNLNKVRYYAYDINKEEINFLNEFFKLSNIGGEAKTLDLSNLENIKHLAKADVCFMFKFVDAIERGKGHKLSEEIIKIIIEKCRFIVVSFSTLTLGNKKMNFPYRGWIEAMLTRIGLRFKMFEIKNEVFYITYK